MIGLKRQQTEVQFEGQAFTLQHTLSSGASAQQGTIYSLT